MYYRRNGPSKAMEIKIVSVVDGAFHRDYEQRRKFVIFVVYLRNEDPAELKGNKGGRCLSACAANLGGDPGIRQVKTLKLVHQVASNIMTFSYRRYCGTEKECPDAYVYAYDESSKAVLWTCDSNVFSCNFRVHLRLLLFPDGDIL
ncbi:hypothetical protein K435DRAFT_792049 [Dendrothele bispora CBS 962.96]|uniref:Uncharacterized protein n=1 Tax=Dendrothele bispora (strain CBS 962.96) TaxID=1314807 RepID=A0A4S8MKI0_DENBC|nr:hypothetical protein K435DRAFT_792049 [Dendrothele bispora CBS 962.96]